MVRTSLLLLCGIAISLSAVVAAPTANCREAEESFIDELSGSSDSTAKSVTPSTSVSTSTTPVAVAPKAPNSIAVTTQSSPVVIAPKAPASISVTAQPENTTPRKASWKDHPVYKANPSSVKPPILAWYTTKAFAKDPQRILVRGMYTRQGSKYKLMREDADADQLVDLDMLQLDLQLLIRESNDPLEFETTRSSRICLLMDVREASNGGKIHQAYTETSSFEMKGPPDYNIDLGIAEWDSSFPLPKGIPASEMASEPPSRGYVVCRDIRAGRHVLPGAPRLGAQWNVHLYTVFFAETDGSPPPLTAPPAGWSGPEIKQHEKCPEQLHEMWSVSAPDTSDPDTRGMTFKTWHPQMDYFYQCYYGHEHGSFEGLAGYTSRFDYTAHKNGRQDESHEGFKNYVLPVGNKFVVVNVHAATDDFNRFQVDLHTVSSRALRIFSSFLFNCSHAY